MNKIGSSLVRPISSAPRTTQVQTSLKRIAAVVHTATA